MQFSWLTSFPIAAILLFNLWSPPLHFRPLKFVTYAHEIVDVDSSHLEVDFGRPLFYTGEVSGADLRLFENHDEKCQLMERHVLTVLAFGEHKIAHAPHLLEFVVRVPGLLSRHRTLITKISYIKIV